MIAGWDATVYVNEEVKHRRHNPGRAAVLSVALLIVIYTFCQIGLQGVISPAKLSQSASPLVYIAQALGGSGWANVMALALALSVIASTGVSIVILARMLYGMASHRVLPAVLGNVSPRFATPAVASIVVGVILIAVTWVYLLSSSLANAFTSLIDVSGMLYASFYLLTALSAVVYYRRRIFSNVVGRAAHRHPSRGRRWVPSLDRGQVVPKRSRIAEVVADRHDRGRRDPDARRAFRPAVAVLPYPARERSQVR